MVLVTPAEVMDRKGNESAMASTRPRIQTQIARLESMRQEAELVAGPEPSKEAGPDWYRGVSVNDPEISAADIDVAFLREKQKRMHS